MMSSSSHCERETLVSEMVELDKDKAWGESERESNKKCLYSCLRSAFL